jgi:hypothetical protein
MKTMSKKLTSLFLTATLILGANTITTKKADAGIIVGLASGGVLGPLVGLGLCATGFFWGIQRDDLNVAAAALFVLDEELNSEKLSDMILKKYPELESYLADEIATLAVQNSTLVEFNAEGLKDVVLSESELAPILEIVQITNPELAKTIKNDFSKSSL